MLTSTAEQRTPALENKDLLLGNSQQFSTANRHNNLSSTLTLKKLYLYASIVGLTLIICGLLLGIKNEHVILTEGFKALTIVGILNLLRAFSIS
jgi:hypothetical protein